MARGPPDLSRRCPRCLFPAAECLCAAVRAIPTRTRFLVLRHASERSRPTNTARWAALALPNLTLVDYAVPGEPVDVDALDLSASAVLFPSPHPARLHPPPRQVVVLDGTWAQARRMLQRIPALRALPRVGVASPHAPRGAAPMRRATVAGGLATVEAMAGALDLLGEPDAADRLRALHREALARGWRLRAGGAHAHLARAT